MADFGQQLPPPLPAAQPLHNTLQHHALAPEHAGMKAEYGDGAHPSAQEAAQFQATRADGQYHHQLVAPPPDVHTVAYDAQAVAAGPEQDPSYQPGMPGAHPHLGQEAPQQRARATAGRKGREGESLGTDDMTEMAAIPEEAMQAAAQAAGLLQLPGPRMKVPGRRGRPPGSKNKKTLALEALASAGLDRRQQELAMQIIMQQQDDMTRTREMQIQQLEMQGRKRRGRPPGSKNKPKSDVSGGLEIPKQASPLGPDGLPIKKPRGRPKGSKNKKTLLKLGGEAQEHFSEDGESQPPLPTEPQPLEGEAHSHGHTGGHVHGMQGHPPGILHVGDMQPHPGQAMLQQHGGGELQHMQGQEMQGQAHYQDLHHLQHAQAGMAGYQGHEQQQAVASQQQFTPEQAHYMQQATGAGHDLGTYHHMTGH